MKTAKVAIIGGGVAGMSAAHELAERGFDVEIFEKLSIPGGKARSIQVECPTPGGGQPLPGEHGFRFFPRFYVHVTDTMKRIPFGPPEAGRNCYDNLVETERVFIGRFNHDPIIAVDRFPRNLSDFEAIIKELHADIDIPREAEKFFAARLWQVVTSCNERRMQEYERIGWWEYIGADRFGENYQTLLAEGFTRTLVAANPRIASTRTVGDILVQLVFDMILPGKSSDMVLNGPTNDVWIDPWLEYLRSDEMNVKYHFNTKVKKISCNPKTDKIESIVIEQDGVERKVEADIFISAVPVEVLAGLLTKEIEAVDPTLTLLHKLKESVNWMNGIQYYLPKDVKLTRGHVLCSDSQWAVTAISQKQFWVEPFSDFEQYCGSHIDGILSVDVSNWYVEAPIFIKNETTGEFEPVMEIDPQTGKETQVEKKADDCTMGEIIATVWMQLIGSVNQPNNILLTDYVFAHIDPDIQLRNPGQLNDVEGRYRDSEPLLVNAIGTWEERPDAFTRIKNFYLAGDFVRTNTDLATMEGANEAARRAVNSIIDDLGYTDVPFCKIWKLHEPDAFQHWRKLDKRRFDKGMKWKAHFSLLEFLFYAFWSFIKNLIRRIFRFKR